MLVIRTEIFIEFLSFRVSSPSGLFLFFSIISMPDCSLDFLRCTSTRFSTRKEFQPPCLLPLFFFTLQLPAFIIYRHRLQRTVIFVGYVVKARLIFLRRLLLHFSTPSTPRLTLPHHNIIGWNERRVVVRSWISRVTRERDPYEIICMDWEYRGVLQRMFGEKGWWRSYRRVKSRKSRWDKVSQHGMPLTTILFRLSIVFSFSLVCFSIFNPLF